MRPNLPFASLACLLVVLAIGGCGASRPAHELPGSATATRTRAPVGVETRLQRAPPATFVSLYPACACGRHTALDVFSLASGRMLRQLAVVPQAGNEQLAAQATSAGRLFLTATSGPFCPRRYRGYMECPRLTPNSCRNSVETLSPGQSQFHTLFTVSDAEALGEAVPNPGGTEAALTVKPCVNLHGIAGLFIRNLKTGSARAVLTTGNRCDWFGPVAWSQSGTELVFPLQRAGKPWLMAGGIACPAGPDYLALAPASGVRAGDSLKLLRSGRGCIFYAAAFDREGVVATKGCAQGGPKGYYSSNLGHSYLLQYSASGRL